MEAEKSVEFWVPRGHFGPHRKITGLICIYSDGTCW